ncbi:Rad52/Rad22 family DNA repair protein [Streptomyces sp. NPDC008150]|uniref:Rad52/Rad22 family DNA repair protein n=1 Tax=Streptomyces sp. NPDC008150 TaxID=3364816 RepID=UPI0036F16A2C
MADAQQAPASITAEGPTSHTQNQSGPRRAGALSDLQIAQLLRPVDPDRVGSDGKGFAHMEAWDIRRYLIRIFGFGGHDTDLLETTLIAETCLPNHQKKDRNGKPYGAPFDAWTVIYRVAVRLAVKTAGGVELGHWHGIATGDATNQPSRADAHDLALKTADSQALKRAATNLGDQFGLSLYNKGSLKPVVQAALPYWKTQEPEKFQDDKVGPEPEVAAARAEAADAGPGRVPAAATTTASEVAEPSAHLTKLMRQATDCWKNPLTLVQIKADGDTHQVLDEEFTAKDGTRTTLRLVLDDRIEELRKNSQEREAA